VSIRSLGSDRRFKLFWQVKLSQFFARRFASTIHRHYSYANVLLIATQRPGASRVAGFHTWRKLGRWVRKGEKGIPIFASIVLHRGVDRDERKDEEQLVQPEGELGKKESNAAGRLAGFKVVHVYDIGQTEGRDLPQFAIMQENKEEEPMKQGELKVLRQQVKRDALRSFQSSAVFLAGFAVAILLAAESASGQLVVGNTPGFVSSAQDLGPENPTRIIDVTLWLRLHNRADLDSLAKELYDPASSQYRHWLKRADFAAIFEHPDRVPNHLASLARQRSNGAVLGDPIGPRNHLALTESQESVIRQRKSRQA
jgi:N-terminal domain of anti-restriction factor ArdC/Pro-kumamolisin, activation domain